MNIFMLRLQRPMSREPKAKAFESILQWTADAEVKTLLLFKSSEARVFRNSFSCESFGKLTEMENFLFQLPTFPNGLTELSKFKWVFPLFSYLSVSFSGQQNGTAKGAFVSSRSEPISLATLDRDCFIIPVRSLERFLPAGVPVRFPVALAVEL